MLDVAADQVDALWLEQLLDDATALADAGQPSAVRDHLEEAAGFGAPARSVIWATTSW